MLVNCVAYQRGQKVADIPISGIRAQLADPGVYADKNKFQQLDEAYKKATAAFDKISTEYDQTFERLMLLEEQIGS